MAKNKRKGYALITGATSGIGYELAKLFADDGYDLVIIARSDERLHEVSEEISSLYKVQVLPIANDLFRKEAAREIFDEVSQRGLQISVLVNDAGQGEWGYFKDTELNRDLDIIQLNISSLVSLTKYFLKGMLERNEGKILNVASLVSNYPSPLLSVYAGTKAFVLSFTEALRSELEDTEIVVTALQPGVTDTDFFYKAGQEQTVAYQQEEPASPVDVAKDGFDALMAGKDKVVSGMKNKMQAAMSNLMSDEKLAGSMKKQNALSDEISRTHSDHQASIKEREMIRTAGTTYKGRDLAHENEEEHEQEHKII
jgi:short-subunit dehydrogenase